MSEAEPLSKAERENIVAHVGLMAPHDYDGRALKAWVGDYEVTVCQVETERDAALAERDELRRHLKALRDVSDAVADAVEV